MIRTASLRAPRRASKAGASHPWLLVAGAGRRSAHAVPCRSTDVLATTPAGRPVMRFRTCHVHSLSWFYFALSSTNHTYMHTRFLAAVVVGKGNGTDRLRIYPVVYVQDAGAVARRDEAGRSPRAAQSQGTSPKPMQKFPRRDAGQRDRGVHGETEAAFLIVAGPGSGEILRGCGPPIHGGAQAGTTWDVAKHVELLPRNFPSLISGAPTGATHC